MLWHDKDEADSIKLYVFYFLSINPTKTEQSEPWCLFASLPPEHSQPIGTDWEHGDVSSFIKTFAYGGAE